MRVLMIVAAVVAAWCLPAAAETGRTVKHGQVTLALDADGRLSFVAADNPLRLANGAWLFQADGKWTYSEPAATMDVVDFVVDVDDLDGKIVRVTGAAIVGARADSAAFTRSGTRVAIVPTTMPKEDVRFVLKECADYVEIDACRVDLVGAAGRDALGNPVLLHPAIARD
ncbi:MAG: hypothetical protein AAGL24_09885 [Pseudomonadota bacterium]